MKTFTLTDLPAIYKSFDENYADLFFEEWKKIFPNIKRVHGVVGMANSGKAACEAADGEYFVLIDGDSFPLPNAIRTETITIPDGYIWHKFQSIQAVTKAVTPHGALAIFHRERGIELCSNAISGTVHCNFQPGFIVVDTIPLSMEFTNQSERGAYLAAYKDCSLFLQKGLDPITYIEKQEIKNLSGKRTRIIPWLVNGADELYGYYSLYGAHKAVYDVFNNSAVHQQRTDIEMFKMKGHEIPVINTHDDLLSLITPFYDELGIEMPFPSRPTGPLVTNMMTRCEQLRQIYDKE